MTARSVVTGEALDEKARAAAKVGAELLEANQQLVLAMMRAQTDAEKTARTLDKISWSAEHDSLTELPDRALLFDRFARAISNAKRHSARLALLFLDLDDFKQINDTLGHAAGDDVLKRVARSLASAVRETDTVSRHGGDEFLVLLTEVVHASDAGLIAEKIISALAEPTRVGEQVLRLTASIGISIYPDDGHDPETLVDRADTAMYRAKRKRLGSFVYYDRQRPGRRSVESPALRLPPPRPPHDMPAPAHHETRRAQREANEQLIFAALSAQELRSGAENAQRHQTEVRAVMATEVRNALTPIRATVTLPGRVGAEELPWVQAIVEREVAQMSRLVANLLDLSRIKGGNLTLHREVLDVAAIVDEAVVACRPAMEARRQRFNRQVPSRALTLQGDRARLVQALSNLLDNASEFTPDEGEVGLSVEVEADNIVIRVSDNGIGISAEALPHVFEPFVQDLQSIGFNGVGLGIGLTAVRKLVEAHGGSVAATSAGNGLGSQFVVTLPVAPTSAILER